MPRLPAAEVRLDDAFDVVAERFANVQKSTKVFPLRPSYTSALIGGSCYLVEISTDRTELGYHAFQRHQLLPRQGLKRSQVRPNEDGYVRRRSHLPGRSPLAE